MPSRVLIDTNLWHYAFVVSEEPEFRPLHDAAREFLRQQLEDDDVRIALSSYQVAEVLEVLRRSQVPASQRRTLREDFGGSKYVLVDVTAQMALESARDSDASGVHVYDYLVAYPHRGVVDAIYSADPHFRHEDFLAIAEVKNPVDPWTASEGRLPTKP